ncbi:MAG: DUF1501 domain-containing protein [Granulosicoccaceae bacterium]
MNRRNMLMQLLGFGATGLSLNNNNLLADQLQVNGQRLILLELSGANDGLNTLVPHSDEQYYSLRPNIGLPKSAIIMLDDDFALHQSLKPLMQLWEQTELAWVHGLGYPKPNRSHFKSIALWETGGDGKADGERGWLTHDIEHAYGQRLSDAHGISLVDDMAVFDSPDGRWLSMKSASKLLQTDYKPTDSEGFTNPLLKRVEQQSHELESMLASLSSKLDKVADVKKMPATGLGRQLSEVIRLIRAGLDTPVYRIRIGGFDTHENQLGRHARRLSELSEAVAATRLTLKQDNEWDNTLIISYSEFGRRAAENKSGGTDHGTAAPHFLAGGALNGGLYGRSPDLSNLIDGDPAHTLDYRSLYEQVLSGWFNIGENQFSGYQSHELNTLFKQV